LPCDEPTGALDSKMGIGVIEAWLVIISELVVRCEQMTSVKSLISAVADRLRRMHLMMESNH
jgi:ABC-type lipoprotein export system ATPase subunit